MEFFIRKAVPEEAEILSRIAVSAKGHWGYSKDQLDLWAKEFLTISPEYIRAEQVWVSCAGAAIVGFAAVRVRDDEAELDHLWIRPQYMGQGIGRELLFHAARMAGQMGHPEIVFTSDPHADGFYYRMGARKIGDHLSVLQKRVLTKFKFALGD
jgi:ribosomal protein S18 acetylase RimI-like enzyme